MGDVADGGDDAYTVEDLARMCQQQALQIAELQTAMQQRLQRPTVKAPKPSLYAGERNHGIVEQWLYQVQ